MSLIEVTCESLGKLLGREVPDAHLLIAKNSVLGVDAFGIAELLGVTAAEVEEIMEDALYKEVRLMVAAEYNSSNIEVDLSYDALEEAALKNLMTRVAFEKDVDTNLKILAIANRAVRRNNMTRNKVLDAGQIGSQVKLQLTKRVIERLTADGGAERETTHEVSIKNGSASNPSFADIDSYLGVSPRARTQANLVAHKQGGQIALEDLTREMDRDSGR